MKYIRNILLGLFFGAFAGFLIGSIFEYKVSKKENWESKQRIQQIVFASLGAIGGSVIGYKLADEK
ncbi:hypothetical protein [Polaribacter marinivivus]|uniref:hypothetical protein n=1 Tax=Polaribacter marinivivus TaxID=1524260 RepID=UPI003D356FAB